MGEGDGHLGQQLRQYLARGQLVGGVDVGEQEGHGHRADLLRADALGRPAEVVVVERGQFVAVGVQPAPDGDDVAARDEGDGLAVADVEHVQAVAAGDVVDVAGAPGGQEDDPLAAALQEGVEAHRGAVDEGPDSGRVADHEGEGVHHPSGQVVAAAGGLGGGVPAEVRVVRHHVGEGAADVGCYPEPQVRFQQATRCWAPMSTSSWGVSAQTSSEIGHLP